MNMCVLVILYSGYGYASPACFSEYGLAVPQDVVYTQHLDSGWNLWIAPPSYVRRYHPRYHHIATIANGGVTVNIASEQAKQSEIDINPASEAK